MTPDPLMSWIGLIAAFLTTIGFVPQVVKSLKTRHVEDVSIWQPAVLISGMVAWLIYGIHLRDTAIILANVFSIVFNSALIFIKIRYQDRRDV
jgi:MtN3 and saliva related transmembrane protein